MIVQKKDKYSTGEAQEKGSASFNPETETLSIRWWDREIITYHKKHSRHFKFELFSFLAEDVDQLEAAGGCFLKLLKGAIENNLSSKYEMLPQIQQEKDTLA